MSSLNKLRDDIDLNKRELKNIRQELLKQKANIKTEVKKMKNMFSDLSIPPLQSSVSDSITKEISSYCLTPVGYISSCFKFKNGTPRQSSLCPTAKGTLKIEKSVFTNPEHSLIGLNEFSYIWLIFIFHQNGHTAIKAKVHPPRLDGKSVGVYSTRSPHRPCPIGLSLAKLEKVEGDTIYLSGIDLVDGTPILDIKPYIPMYDSPLLFKEAISKEKESGEELALTSAQEYGESEQLQNIPTDFQTPYKESDSILQECRVPDFLKESSQKLDVLFTNRALKNLEILCSTSNDESLCKRKLSQTRQSIVEVLQNDPRSVYRKDKCSDKLYYFYIDDIHVTCWFDETIAEVLKIKSSSLNPHTSLTD